MPDHNENKKLMTVKEWQQVVTPSVSDYKIFFYVNIKFVEFDTKKLDMMREIVVHSSFVVLQIHFVSNNY